MIGIAPCSCISYPASALWLLPFCFHLLASGFFLLASDFLLLVSYFWLLSSLVRHSNRFTEVNLVGQLLQHESCHIAPRDPDSPEIASYLRAMFV